MYKIVLSVIAATVLTGIASPAFGQERHTAGHRHLTKPGGPYASSKDTPYSNRSQRRDREARRQAKKIERDAEGDYFHFEPVDRERDDD